MKLPSASCLKRRHKEVELLLASHEAVVELVLASHVAVVELVLASHEAVVELVLTSHEEVLASHAVVELLLARHEVEGRRQAKLMDCDIEDITEERAAKNRVEEANETVNDKGEEEAGETMNVPIHEEMVNDEGEQEEAIVDSDHGSVDGDDCEVIVEDTAGYKEVEPELAEDEEDTEAAEEEEEEVEEPHEDIVDVRICDNLSSILVVLLLKHKAMMM